MTIRTRLRDILLGVILFPLIAPILIAAQKGSFEILDGQSLKSALDYIELLVVIDVIYLVGGLWSFGPLREE
jgi:ABC-type transport system involved in cytochrome c biogenesis permease component